MKRGAPFLLPAVALCGLLGGCASYTAQPLATAARLAPSIADLRHDDPLPARLDADAIGRLAVLNDPDLVAVRAQRGVADAQVLQAGLLPNPQASASIAPTLAGPGTTNAWNAGVTQDLRSLILRPSAERAARQARLQIEADILWQEWQVAGQARLLAVQLIEGGRQIRQLADEHVLLTRFLAARQRAIADGDATYATVAPDLASVASLQAQLDAMRQSVLKERHALAALLGLEPDAAIPLADEAGIEPPDPRSLAALVPALPRRRPDLLALRYGYEAANQKLRGAILLQFPNVSFGGSGGSDNSNVRSFGPQLNLELPIFDHGQGQIAAARATRAQLHAAYDARLAATAGELRARAGELVQLTAQLAAARAALPAVDDAARAAASPDVAGLVDPQMQADLLGARLTRAIEITALEQQRLEQIVAIQTLAGIGMPQEHT